MTRVPRRARRARCPGRAPLLGRPRHRRRVRHAGGDRARRRALAIVWTSPLARPALTPTLSRKRER
jgi:hypothetical protein